MMRKDLNLILVHGGGVDDEAFTHCLLSLVDRRTVLPLSSVVVAVPIVDRSMPAIWLKYRSLSAILTTAFSSW